MNELKQKALEVAEMFDEQAQFGYEMILRAEGNESAVARQLTQYQVQFAKEHEANAQLLRDLVAALESHESKALDNLMEWQQEFDKPVAWMELYYGEPNNLAWTNAELKDSGDIYKTVPLYTAPRELSDVEIHYEVDKWERQNNYKHDADVHKTLIDFARAILKKASEK